MSCFFLVKYASVKNVLLFSSFLVFLLAYFEYDVCFIGSLLSLFTLRSISYDIITFFKYLLRRRKMTL